MTGSDYPRRLDIPAPPDPEQRHEPLPVVLIGRSYWERLLDFEFLLEEGAIDAEDRDSFWFAEDAQEAWEGILDWHVKNGEPLFPAVK